MIRPKKTSLEIETELLNSLVPEYKYELNFISSFYISNNTIEPLIKAFKLKDSNIKEYANRGNQQYNGRNNKYIYLKTNLHTEDIKKFTKILEKDWDNLEIIVKKVK